MEPNMTEISLHQKLARQFWHGLHRIADPSTLDDVPADTQVETLQLIAIEALSKAVTPDSSQHLDDLSVDQFFVAMKAKLARKRRQGYGGWDDKANCSNDRLSALLRDHVDKGDPIDVANFAMMIHQRGERIGAACPETLRRALKSAIDHIEHMAKWIANQKAGYSFEGLHEDMPGMRAALENNSPSSTTFSIEGRGGPGGYTKFILPVQMVDVSESHQIATPVTSSGVTYTQAECDEMCETAARDGYSNAVQEIDQKTGGDGEYRCCLGMEDSARHTPDPATMIQRIVDRFEVLNLLDEATKTRSKQPDDSPVSIPGSVEEEIARVVQSVNEWDDRTSPDDYPEHLLITSDELAEILRDFANNLTAAANEVE